ncbi:hypothetical protein [Natronococcus jeotgali]|nr:hypothetical protein [Natronococcus jeotgali]
MDYSLIKYYRYPIGGPIHFAPVPGAPPSETETAVLGGEGW